MRPDYSDQKWSKPENGKEHSRRGRPRGPLRNCHLPPVSAEAAVKLAKVRRQQRLGSVAATIEYIIQKY